MTAQRSDELVFLERARRAVCARKLAEKIRTHRVSVPKRPASAPAVAPGRLKIWRGPPARARRARPWPVGKTARPTRDPGLKKNRRPGTRPAPVYWASEHKRLCRCHLVGAEVRGWRGARLLGPLAAQMLSLRPRAPPGPALYRRYKNIVRKRKEQENQNSIALDRTLTDFRLGPGWSQVGPWPI